MAAAAYIASVGSEISSGVVLAVLGAALAVGARWAPRTPREARVEDTQIYHDLNGSLNATVATLERRLEAVETERDEIENELAECRAELDRSRAECQRLRILIDRA